MIASYYYLSFISLVGMYIYDWILEKKSKHPPYSISREDINSNKTLFYMKLINFPKIHAGINELRIFTFELTKVLRVF